MSETIVYVPGRLKSAVKGGHATGTEDIYDDELRKTQKEINAEQEGSIAAEVERATEVEELLQSEINGFNSQNYVSVDSYSDLPSLGSVDTIYRVGSWDGTQIDATKYAEYAWKNTGIDQGEYVLLSVKTQVGEVFDISGYHGGATYADLAAALDGGNNVPAGIRRGGMSVKFVNSSDNKYVQYFLTKDEWSVSEGDWEKINLAKNVINLENKQGDFFLYDSNGESINNTIIFTSADVNIGQKLYYKITCAPLSAESGVGVISFYDSSNVNIGYYGFSSTTPAGTVKNGTFIIPSNFSYAKVEWGRIIVNYVSELECGNIADTTKQLQSDVTEIQQGIVNEDLFINPTPSIKRKIRELYLKGTDSSKTYIARYCRYNTEGGYNKFQLIISESSAPNTFVAGYEGAIKDGVVPISAMNNSGISGYAIIDLTTNDTTNEKASFNTAIISDINKSPVLSDFAKNNGYRTVIVAKSGTRDFSNIREAVDFGVRLPNTKVIIKRGVYDLTEDWSGQIAGGTQSKYGNELWNGIYLQFEAGAEVNAIYEGTNPDVTTYFNPFYSGQLDGGYTIDGLKIHAKNCRYCLHDEFSGSARERVNIKIINCEMWMDNSTAPINYYPQCIGGGVAQYQNVEIINCRFHTSASASTAGAAVSYHNQNKYASGFSKIIVRDCYFADLSTFASLNYGSNTTVSEAWLNNNSFGSSPINENVGGTGPDQPVNFVNYEWNNEIRSK